MNEKTYNYTSVTRVGPPALRLHVGLCVMYRDEEEMRHRVHRADAEQRVREARGLGERWLMSQRGKK